MNPQPIMILILACCLVGVVTALIFRSLIAKKSKDSIPRIGMSPYGLFALQKARADFLVNGRHLVEEGYEKVCKAVRDDLQSHKW